MIFLNNLVDVRNILECKDDIIVSLKIFEITIINGRMDG